jgi:hypothetical protein
MLDIREGDLLVVGSTEYVVKNVAPWTGFGSILSFRRLATVDASIKRRPNVVAGERGDPSIIAEIRCAPLDPISADIAQTLGLKVPYHARQTFAADTDGFVQIIVMDKGF